MPPVYHGRASEPAITKNYSDGDGFLGAVANTTVVLETVSVANDGITTQSTYCSASDGNTLSVLRGKLVFFECALIPYGILATFENMKRANRAI